MRLFVVTALRIGLRCVAVALLAAAVLVAILWPVGYRTAYVPFAFHIGIGVIQGGVDLVYSTEGLPAWPPSLLTFPVNAARPRSPVPHEWMGFGFGVAANGEGQARVPAPAAIVVLLVAAASAWTIARGLPRYGSAGGRCPACGYDVRATPDRCPECGGTIRPAA